MAGPLPDVIDLGSLQLTEIKVFAEGKTYLLREATGEVACRYRNAVLSRIELKDDKVSRFKDIAELEPYLVSLCLYDTEGNRVPEATIRNWPSRVVRKLFELAKKLSWLDEAAPNEESLKKAPESTEAGSS